MATDLSEQLEELESLAAIYGDDCSCSTIDDASGGGASNVCEVHVPSRGAPRAIVLRALLPANYPSASPPILELRAGDDDHHAPAAELDAATRDLEERFEPGTVCLFDIVEALKECHQRWEDDAEAVAAAEEAEAAAAGRSGRGGADSEEDDEDLEALRAAPESTGREGRAASPSGRNSNDADAAALAAAAALIVSGEPFLERKSTFQAHVARVTSVEQAHAVIAALLASSPKIRNATHNMSAYRIAAPGRPGVYHQDYDDDGEAAAGSRLLRLLVAAGVEGVVVVVSRWFGGVLLGPSRFALINNVARALLVQQGFISGGGGGGRKKK